MHDDALVLDGVGKRLNGAWVFTGLDLRVAHGELTVISAPRGAGKTTLARLIAGQTLPDAGRIERAGRCAPPPGASWGFVGGMPVTRCLDLRAAVYDIDTRDYIDRIAALMDNPEALRAPFEMLRGRDRTIVQYASSWLLGTPIHVVDGAPLPSDAVARERLLPLWRAARGRGATVIWIASSKRRLRGVTPSRRLALADGRLRSATDKAAV